MPAIETPAAARAGHSSQAVARGAEAFPPDLFAGLTESGAALCEGGVTAAAQFVPYLSALAEAPGRLRAALESDEACALRRVVCAGRLLLQRLEADPELAAALRAPDALLRALLRLDFEAAAQLGDEEALLWAALDPEGGAWLRAQRRAGGHAGVRAARLLEQLGAPLLTRRLGLDYTVLCLWQIFFSVWSHDLGRNIQREASRVAPMEIRPPGFLAPWLVPGNVVPSLKVIGAIGLRRADPL